MPQLQIPSGFTVNRVHNHKCYLGSDNLLVSERPFLVFVKHREIIVFSNDLAGHMRKLAYTLQSTCRTPIPFEDCEMAFKKSVIKATHSGLSHAGVAKAYAAVFLYAVCDTVHEEPVQALLENGISGKGIRMVVDIIREVADDEHVTEVQAQVINSLCDYMMEFA